MAASSVACSRAFTALRTGTAHFRTPIADHEDAADDHAHCPSTDYKRDGTGGIFKGYVEDEGDKQRADRTTKGKSRDNLPKCDQGQKRSPLGASGSFLPTLGR